MRSFGERRLGTAARALMAATLASCVGDIGSPEGGGPSRPPPPVFCGDDTLSLGAIATRRLSPVEQHNTLADLLPGVTFEAYAFAPQTTEHGFENFVANTGSVPDTHVEAYAFNALRAAAATVADPDGLARVVGCSAWETEPERDACRDVLLDEFSLRAHRRPITEAQRESYRTFFESVRDEIDFEAAVELTLASMLQAPESTYRVEASVSEGLDGWEIASRLSYFLWQSMPDDVLFEAAAEGALQRPRELRAQVERMLDDPRATAALTDFHRQWLRFDQMFDPRHSAKDPATFPEWTPELQASVREEAPRFVAHLMQDDATATLEALLTSRTALVDAELAAHYGLPAVEGWTEVELPADERAGFLTRANFLAGRGNAGRLSPIHSGLFVIERMLCGTIGQPDEIPSLPEDMPGMPRTERERYEDLTSPGECQNCHARINPIGFSFEHYTSTGAFRTEDNGFAVDASGALNGSDADGPVANAVELSERLAQSDTVLDCVAEQWVAYSVGRRLGRDDYCFVERVQESLRDSEGNVRELLLAMATSPEFLMGAR